MKQWFTSSPHWPLKWTKAHFSFQHQMGRLKWICYLWPMRAAKVEVSLCIRAVSPEPLLLTHTSSASRRTFTQKARYLAPLNGRACTVKICHDGMLKDTDSLDTTQIQALPAKSQWKVTLHGPGHAKKCLMPYANNKGADQPAHPLSLISTIVVCCLDSIIPLVSISEISRL